jgi:3-hydroxypropanoate dehydrogenase
MSGFDNAKVDEEFFGAGVERDGMCEEYIPGTVKSNFLCSIGYGDPASVRRAWNSRRSAAYSES